MSLQLTIFVIALVFALGLVVVQTRRFTNPRWWAFYVLWGLDLALFLMGLGVVEIPTGWFV